MVRMNEISSHVITGVPKHCNQVSRLLSHSAWPTWADHLSRRLEHLCSLPGRPELYVILFCKSGRDRSVGLGVAVERKLRQHGWATHLRHLCISDWRNNPACRHFAEQYSRHSSPGVSRTCPVCWTGNSDHVVRKLTSAFVVPAGK